MTAGHSTAITIRIDRIVLDGFGRLDQERLRRAVESGLTSLLNERGLPGGLMNPGDRASIDAGQIDGFATGETAIGAQIAERIYEGLGG